MLTFDIAWLYIRFKYGGKEWRIELWKGIYGKIYGLGMSTGAEIGIYTRKNNYFPGWYKCASNDDCMKMSYDLYSDGKKLYSRNSIERDNYKGKHWWLTGFKVGVKKKPRQLSMKNVNITFKDEEMAKRFENALKKALGNKNTGKAKSIVRYKSRVVFCW